VMWRELATTRAPFPANAVASARPMPLDAPVMTTVLGDWMMAPSPAIGRL
jgi:hypothetical protein